jgi:hypothetical protein
MTKRVGQILRALAGLALAAGLLSCSAGAEAGAQTTAATASPVRSVPFDLYTHCGIDEALVGTTYFEAETPLDDGSGNPPEGWDNPSQRGTMTLTSRTRAVFTDDAGHEVAFRARPGATAFKAVCA